jgi:hypothetical protein
VPPPRGGDVVIAGVAFTDLKHRAREKPSAFGPHGSKHWTPRKAPFKVPAASIAAIVSIAQANQRSARLIIGLDGPPYTMSGPAFELRPCPAAQAPRTAFVGGFQLRHSSCVRVRVETATATASKRIAFGRGACAHH